MGDIFSRQGPQHLPFETERDLGPWSAGKIDNRTRQGLIQGRIGPAEAGDPSPVSEGAVERSAEGEGTVFSCVVVIDFEISTAFKFEIPPRMERKVVTPFIKFILKKFFNSFFSGR